MKIKRIKVITAIKKVMERKLALAREQADIAQKRFETMVQHSSDVFQIIMPDGTIEYVSPAIKNIFGVDPNEVTGKKIGDFFDAEMKMVIEKLFQEATSGSGRYVQTDLYIRLLNGAEAYVDVTVINQLDEPTIRGFVLNWRDITQRVETEKMISYMAVHDDLTQLPNRVALKNELIARCGMVAGEAAAFEQFSVMMLKFDGLENVHETLGDEYADQLLIEIAGRLKELMRTGEYLARYKETEFAVLVPGSNRKEYMQIAWRFIEAFMYPLKLDIFELYVDIAIGISVYPEDAKEPELLLKQANTAIFRSKQEGKNQYRFYSSGIEETFYRQFVINQDMRRAAEKNELITYFQPVVNNQTGEIIACEALIRWNHPVWGLLSPAEFIPLAEETGMIVSMGWWMLHQVCRNYKEWMEMGFPPIKVSLNFSGVQFLERNIPEKIKRIIDEYELDPHFLIIELTESVLMKNREKVVSDIRALQECGIQIAIDDFGTGYSSLGYLKSFNIDILKLDRTFIKDMITDKTTQVILNSIIRLARSLKIKLVAEGIETKDQSQRLIKLKCFAGQGYLYSRPLPPSEFISFMTDNRKLQKLKTRDAGS